MGRCSPHDMTTRIQRRRWIRRRLLPAFIAAAVAVVGCAQAPDASPWSGRRMFRDDSWGFPVCLDLPELAAPPEAYRDEPIYVFSEGPVAEVKAWAESQPGYEETWTSDHLGWIAVAFSRDAEARQRDLEKEFPDVGVVAVPVERTKAELEALAGRVGDKLAPLLAEHRWLSIGASVHKGVAHLKVGVLTEELRRAIEEGFSGEPLCVEGIDPASLPVPGPQPSGGDGWRLLAEGEGIRGRGRISLATDAASYSGLWADWDAPVPEVDFQDHVVIRFVAVHSGSCPDIRLDDVTVDGDVVYPEIVNLTTESRCTSDANYYPYVVALQRSRLPPGPFVIQLESETPPYAKPDERLLVDGDLSAPGAVPGPGAVRPDASLSEPTPDESGLLTGPGYPNLYRLDTRCGIEWLGEVNGVAWRTDEAMPEEWESAVEADGGLNVSMTMYVEPEPLIEAKLNGETVVYKPTAEEIPKCRP